ncbi:hypothetical protein [Pseudolysinimonas sp.]|nr:hypothetical protein [Pseudolysinimonas sp.]
MSVVETVRRLAVVQVYPYADIAPSAMEDLPLFLAQLALPPA